MSAFETMLRQQIMDTQRALLRAEQEGDEAAETMHEARLWDLLDRAAVNGIDSDPWISGEASSHGSPTPSALQTPSPFQTLGHRHPTRPVGAVTPPCASPTRYIAFNLL